MAHPMYNNDYGFPFARTELDGEVLVGQEVGQDTIAWLDLDNDDQLDLIAITVQTGEEEDTDHELVALHIPSGKALWRARNGEVSQKLAVVDDVLIASTDNSRVLRGFDPKSGEELWKRPLSDALENHDAFDGDEVAHAITGRGAWAIFQCIDDSIHIVVAKTGGLIKSFEESHLEHHWLDIPGLVCFVDSENKFVAWDIARKRAILQTDRNVAPAIGNGEFALIEDHHDYSAIHIFDSETLERRMVIRANTEEKRALPQRSGAYARQGAWLLSAQSLVIADDEVYWVRWEEVPPPKPETAAAAEPQTEPPKRRGFFSRLFGGADKAAPAKALSDKKKKQEPSLAQKIAPPQAGYVFAGMSLAGDTLGIAFSKQKGTEKLILVGYDPATMAQRWQTEDLGGRAVEVSVLSTNEAFFVPHSPRPEDHHWHDGNKQSWFQLSPEDGSKISEYPVAEIQGVEIHGKYLCAMGATYGSATPVAYDTTTRERVL